MIYLLANKIRTTMVIFTTFPLNKIWPTLWSAGEACIDEALPKHDNEADECNLHFGYI